MTSGTLEQRLRNLHTWKRGDTRAVHKPLLTLYLLARAQRGGANAVSFREVREPLAEALRLFGPPRRRVQPELPFWHLQYDGFWRVLDSQRLPRGKRGDRPTARALLEHDAVGEVPARLWAQLKRSPRRIPRLARSVLEQFWPESLHDDIARFFGLELEEAVRTPRDPAFRDAVLRAYERRCAVCGFDARLRDALVCVEAAHVRFRQFGGPDEVRNGLALCSLHHKAFDLGAIGVSEDRRVLVSQDLSGSDTVRRQLVAYAGQPLLGPQSPGDAPRPHFIKWHLREVFRGPARVSI